MHPFFQTPVVAILFIVALTGSYTIPAQNNPDNILGNWRNEKNDTQIQVYKKNGKYYGKITWLAIADQYPGDVIADEKNPDLQKRNQPIVGSDFLFDLVYKPQSKGWKEGTIYDPGSGETYQVAAYLGKDGILTIRGFVGSESLGESETWHRAKASDSKE
jgi:uncharacterized protein (DUF2147 family)